MKSRILSLSLFSLVCISITTACSYTVEQLVRDEPLRLRILKDCAAMGTDAISADKCKKAAEAQAKVTGNAIKGLFN